MNSTCPFPNTEVNCQSQATYQQDNTCRVECSLCGGCAIDSRLVRAPTTLSNWNGALGAVRELRHRKVDLPLVTWCPTTYQPLVWGIDFNDERQEIYLPTSIREKSSRLLSALVHLSTHYRETIKLRTEVDYPLAYAKNSDEFLFFTDYLVDTNYVERISHRDSKLAELRVTPKGYEAHESSELNGGLVVFVSSTCFDLIDCRAELAKHLQSSRHTVLLSDDPYNFDIPQTGHSIDSCLHNVALADVVVCIIDGRVGPTLEKFGYEGKSATQVEVEQARLLGIPIRFFLRKQVFTEFGLLKRSMDIETSKTARVEPFSSKHRSRWLDFVRECIEPSQGTNANNWFDQFDSVVDLKLIVDKRLYGIKAKNR